MKKKNRFLGLRFGGIVLLLLTASTTLFVQLALAEPTLPAEEDADDGTYELDALFAKQFVSVSVGKYSLKYTNRKKVVFKPEHCPEGYALVDPAGAGKLEVITKQLVDKHNIDNHLSFFGDPLAAGITIAGTANLPKQAIWELPRVLRPALTPALPPRDPKLPPGPAPIPKVPDLAFVLEGDTYYLKIIGVPVLFVANKSATLSDGKTYYFGPEKNNTLVVVSSDPKATFVPVCKKMKKCDTEEDADSMECIVEEELCEEYDCTESSSSSSEGWSDSSSSESSFSSDSSDSVSSESSSDSSDFSDAYSSAWSSESSSACAWWDWYCNAGSSSSESSSYGWSSSESSSDSSSSSSEDWSSSSVSSESWQSSSF